MTLDEFLRKRYREMYPAVTMPMPVEHPACRCAPMPPEGWQATAGEPSKLTRPMLEGMYAELVRAAGRTP